MSRSNPRWQAFRACRASAGRVWAAASVASLIGLLALAPGFAAGQVADFKIRWSEIGEVATAQDQPVRAGKRLFSEDDVSRFSREGITIARVDAEPTVVTLNVGERFCLTALQVSAFTEARRPVSGAPLSVSVQQDHLEALQVKSGRRNVCFDVAAAGEYPVRLTSRLPARDGTVRGAQVFLRVRAKASGTDKTTPAEPAR